MYVEEKEAKRNICLSVKPSRIFQLKQEGIENLSQWFEEKIEEELQNELIRQCPECNCAAKIRAWRRWNWICGGNDNVGCGVDYSKNRPALLQVVKQ